MTPTRRSIALATAGLVVAVLPAIVDARLWTVWAASTGALAIAIATDALLLPRRRGLDLAVTAPAALQIGEPGALRVTVAHRGAAPSVALSALADLDERLERQPEVWATRAARAALAEVPIVPKRRGVARIESVWVRLRGPFGLAEKRFRHPTGLTVRILPDVRPVRAAALKGVNRTESAIGARSMRYVGEGSEFAALRDYVPGFDHRAMSWRASARHRQLLVREFHAERDQPVVVAIDTGRLMSEPLEGMARLDHAIHAGLLLAWSCLKTGDRVGLFSFGARPGAFRPPEAAVGSFARARAWAAGLEYGTDESNYTLALAHLSERLKRRTLVVMLTDFVDVVAARLMIDSLAKLVTRHLVLFVTLTDAAPRRILEQQPRSIADVHRAVVAAQLIRERETVLLRLRRLGAHCIDAEPAGLQPELVQRYLWIKRRELL